jgi:formylglycine-generating enzyme required for sulfatase activity
MANAANNLNIVILNVCQNNPFSRQFCSMNAGLGDCRKRTARWSYVSYSTAPGQVDTDSVCRSTPFAAAFMQYVKEPDLTIEQVFKNARHRLNHEAVGKQVPWELSGKNNAIIKNDPSPDRSVTETDTDTLKDTATVIEFILFNGGCYQMGDRFCDGLPSEKPLHEFCIDSFYLGKHEVTQGKWKKMMGVNLSHFQNYGMNCPVENVT